MGFFVDFLRVSAPIVYMWQLNPTISIEEIVSHSG